MFAFYLFLETWMDRCLTAQQFGVERGVFSLRKCCCGGVCRGARSFFCQQSTAVDETIATVYTQNKTFVHIATFIS